MITEEHIRTLFRALDHGTLEAVREAAEDRADTETPDGMAFYRLMGLCDEALTDVEDEE